MMKYKCRFCGKIEYSSPAAKHSGGLTLNFTCSNCKDEQYDKWDVDEDLLYERERELRDEDW